MYACDFEYDGVKLSDLGYIVCEFNGDNGVETANAGSEITFITVPTHSGKRYRTTGTKYDKCLSTSFQICKDPEKYNENEMSITDDEFRELSRWLNRRDYRWFHKDIGDQLYDQPWVRASFNLTKIDIGKVTYGAELSMVTDAPFGYGEEQTATLSFAAGALSQTFTDPSDEIGDTYPDMTITCGSSGNLTLSDDVTGCSMEISNCVSGEVLTISGETMTISTSSTTHNATLADDFNYIFFRFGNTFGNRTNTITSSMPCNVVMTFRPIIKDTL